MMNQRKGLTSTNNSNIEEDSSSSSDTPQIKQEAVDHSEATHY